MLNHFYSEQAPLPMTERAAVEQSLAAARVALGKRVAEVAWATGSSFTQAQALADALAAPTPNRARDS